MKATDIPVLQDLYCTMLAQELQRKFHVDCCLKLQNYYYYYYYAVPSALNTQYQYSYEVFDITYHFLLRYLTLIYMINNNNNNSNNNNNMVKHQYLEKNIFKKSVIHH